ncbi:hypothetical protein Moror_11386 [Moniliophthora roreri MCA 2997]|uniref:Queuosine 5'-phosphate N-glycosylase/hydrolase n=1 Tax=Moniliophthora roreri (strain MCA 2997) TaxID=1381753 RepID=V2Y0R8_MONRO|nr:hypothetical protein Moror_11386 [Moniliophthora roreri MCA 2997]KAI3596973.1 hypothetical protein WG66_006354 [Moniliophthora roreri]
MSLQSIRQSSKLVVQSTNIQITVQSITRLLLSPAFTCSFHRVSNQHGLALPLNFSSPLAELNLVSILSLLNFGSGYRLPLHQQSGRGAWDNIRMLVFGMYISSEDLLSAKGIKDITQSKIAEIMRVSIHTETPHSSIPGVTVGTLGGPMHNLVNLITSTLNETGTILVQGGYPDLGSFVLEALNAAKAKESDEAKIDCILHRLVSAFPAFRDQSSINNHPIYCFKKALFLIHALTIRFTTAQFPIPNTSTIPVFSDNVLPTLLIHLGIIDLSHVDDLVGLFPVFDASTLQLPSSSKNDNGDEKQALEDGPHLTSTQSYILRAAAIHACERIIEVARSLDLSDDDKKEFKWINELTLPDLDMWIWSIAKDRKDWRRGVKRFVCRDTVYF